MQKLMIGIVAIALGLPAFAGTARALDNNEPGIAKAFKANVLTAYDVCVTPNTVTDGSIPACAPVRSDPVCGFTVGGHGLIYIRSKDARGWAVKIVVLGLDQGCIGQQIKFVANLRSTNKNCAGEPCTVEMSDVELGTCTVSGRGFCGISTPLFPAVAGPLNILNQRGGAELTDFRGLRGSLTTLTTGIRNKAP